MFLLKISFKISPFSRCRCLAEKIADPPKHASACSHKLYFSHTSAISFKPSKAPSTWEIKIILIAQLRTRKLFNHQQCLTYRRTTCCINQKRFKILLNCVVNFSFQIIDEHLTALVSFNWNQILHSDAKKVCAFDCWIMRIVRGEHHETSWISFHFWLWIFWKTTQMHPVPIHDKISIIDQPTKKTYMLAEDPPGHRIPSPLVKPKISSAFLITSSSINVKAGPISKVYWPVFSALVIHSAPNP